MKKGLFFVLMITSFILMLSCLGLFGYNVHNYHLYNGKYAYDLMMSIVSIGGVVLFSFFFADFFHLFKDNETHHFPSKWIKTANR